MAGCPQAFVGSSARRARAPRGGTFALAEGASLGHCCPRGGGGLSSAGAQPTLITLGARRRRSLSPRGSFLAGPRSRGSAAAAIAVGAGGHLLRLVRGGRDRGDHHHVVGPCLL